MVMITISYTTLQQVVGKNISIEELEDALFNMGMELDEFDGDDSLSIEITSERLDLMSAQGIGRAVRAFLGYAGMPKYTVHKSDYVVKLTKELDDVRPHTVCAVVKNLHVTETRLKQIIDVQEKFHATLARGRRRGAIGIYPMEVIHFPITFTADIPSKILFHPLGADKIMSGSDILTQHETGKAYAHLLDGLKKYSYFIDAKNEILSMPPIINSEKTGRVTEQTTSVFIECSGHDEHILQQLLVHITTMFADMGAEIYAVTLEYDDGKRKVTPQLDVLTRTVSLSTITKYTGLQLDESEVRSLLSKMMYEVQEVNKDVFTLHAPAFRFDLWHEIDVVDDIARAYGYNNLPLTIPKVLSVGGVLPKSKLREEISDVFVGLGFLETYTFGLTAKKDQFEHMLLDETNIDFIPVANGNETQTMMRVSLLPEQLKALACNRSYQLPQKIFEGAFVIIPDAKQDVLSRNEMHLSAMIADKVVTFTQIRQVLDAVVKSRGIEVSVKQVSHPSFLKGRVGEIYLADKKIGIIGELHPQVLENFGLVTPVACFELNLETLL